MKMIVMMMMMVLVAFATASNLTISNTLGSNMVLQRAPASAKVWGWVTPGEQVYALLDSTSITAVVSTDGFWIATLPPTPAGATHTIAVTSSDGGKIVLTNILFGEVYLCGGQSNMQFTVSQVFNATAEIQAADNYPNIRVMSVGTLYYSPEPLDELHVPPQLPWSVASAASVGLGDWTAMSAVCWFTGRNLYDNLQVPIGLISSNWGGTVIQAWSSPDALKVCNVTTSGEKNEANSVLYNAMIVPFQNYQLAGFLWYQGEQNAGQAQLYSCMFPAMINDWRELFGSELPFFFVQLAPFAAGSSSSWPDTRQAQLNALTLDKVAFASAVDLGDPTSPFGDVHPRDKQDVGKRLSVAVRAVAYGEQGLNWQGPTFSSAKISQAGSTVTITVNFNAFGGALEYKNQTYPPTSIVPAADCSNWAYQTSDGIWTEITDAELNGASVTLPFQESRNVTGIAYAYASWPITTLFDADGLPAIPFKYIVS